MDADGFFYFVVRLKRMIKSSGFNVYPAQVEAVLREHPAVAEACVIGVPDPAQVERVKACVVPRDPGAGGPRARRRADRALPRAADQVVVPARDRVRRRAAAHQGGQDRLSRTRAPARGKGEELSMTRSNIPANGGERVAAALSRARRALRVHAVRRAHLADPGRGQGARHSASSTRATKRRRCSPPTPWRASPARRAWRR